MQGSAWACDLVCPFALLPPLSLFSPLLFSIGQSPVASAHSHHLIIGSRLWIPQLLKCSIIATSPLSNRSPVTVSFHELALEHNTLQPEFSQWQQRLPDRTSTFTATTNCSVQRSCHRGLVWMMGAASLLIRVAGQHGGVIAHAQGRVLHAELLRQPRIRYVCTTTSATVLVSRTIKAERLAQLSSFFLLYRPQPLLIAIAALCTQITSAQ